MMVTLNAVFCSDGDLRLIGGTIDEEGRVEICINEVWGTICDDGWTNQDAMVVCRNLGFSMFSKSCIIREFVLVQSFCEHA